MGMTMSPAAEMTLEQKIDKVMAMVETISEKLDTVAQIVISRVDIVTRIQDTLERKVVELDASVTIAIETLKTMGLTLPLLTKTHEMLAKLSEHQEKRQKRKRG